MTGPSKTDPDGPKPTVSQAKAAWEAQKKPTLNKVLAALHAAGFTGMIRSTLYRWQKKGWPDHQSSSGLGQARAAVTKEATQKVVDDGVVAEEKAIGEVAELKKLAGPMTTLEDIKRVEIIIGEIMLARRIQLHPDYLVKFTARDIGEMIKSLKAPPSNVTVVMPSATEKPPEPRTVGGTLIEHDAGERPLNQFEKSLQEFEQRRGLQVVK